MNVGDARGQPDRTTELGLLGISEKDNIVKRQPSSSLKKRCSRCLTSKPAFIAIRVTRFVGSLGLIVAGFCGIGAALTCSTLTVKCDLLAIGGAVTLAAGLTLSVLAGIELKQSIQSIQSRT